MHGMFCRPIALGLALPMQPSPFENSINYLFHSPREILFNSSTIVTGEIYVAVTSDYTRYEFVVSP